MKINKTVKWILIAVLIIAVLAFLIYLITHWGGQNQPPPAPGTPPAPGAGIASILSGFFSSDWVKNLLGGNKNPEMGDPACNKNDPGFDNNGYYTRKCGGIPGGAYNCDPDNPGKDMFGFNNSQCGG